MPARPMLCLVIAALLAGCATERDPCPTERKVLIDGQLICGFDRRAPVDE